MSIKQSAQLFEALRLLRKMRADIIGFRVGGKGKHPVVYIEKPSNAWLRRRAIVRNENDHVRWYEVSFYLCVARWFERRTPTQQQRGKAS